MGLLSRFGKGLKATAPLFGQMAQYSMLQEADEKKYNRLLEAEERKRDWDLELHGMKTESATAAALSKSRQDFFTNEKKLLNDRLQSLDATLKPFLDAQGNFLDATEERAALRDSILKRIKSTQDTYNRIDKMQQGALGISELPEIEAALKEAQVYVALDTTIATGIELVDSYLEQNILDLQHSDINYELPTINAVVEDQLATMENELKAEGYEVTADHKEYYRNKLIDGVKDKAAEEKSVTDTDDKKDTITDRWDIITPEELGKLPWWVEKGINWWMGETYKAQETERKAMEKLETLLEPIFETGAERDRRLKSIGLSESGKSFLDLYSKAIESLKEADADTRKKFDYTYLEEMFESLSDEDKKILQELDTSLGMTRDSLNLPIPDVNESAFVAPSDKSIQRMIESFTDAQRIA